MVKGRAYQLWDVGGARSERENWVHVLEKNVNMLVFTIDCACYNQVLNEDYGFNRMDEQLTLWSYVARSRCVKGKRIMVMFTKEDKLTPEMMRRYPFGAKFADFNGDPESVDDIIKYLTWRVYSVFDREEGSGGEHVTFCRLGTISESLKVWEKLLSVQGNFF